MKNKALLSTSIMLIASQALASAAEINKQKNGEDSHLSMTKIKSIKENDDLVKQTQNTTKNLLNKPVVKKSSLENHKNISAGLGDETKSMNSKYYGDLVERLKLAQSNAQYDSTNLSPTGATGDFHHCHGACHGLLPPVSFEMGGKSLKETVIQAEGGDKFFNTSNKPQKWGFFCSGLVR